jgi:hypothetical protein
LFSPVEILYVRCLSMDWWCDMNSLIGGEMTRWHVPVASDVADFERFPAGGMKELTVNNESKHHRLRLLYHI